MRGIRFLPQTSLGKWSLGLNLLMPGLIFLGWNLLGFYESVPAGRTIPQDLVTRPGVGIPILAGFACGIAAFFTGVTSIVSKKDYSVAVFLSSALGLVTLLWCVAEILFPH